MKQVLEKIRTLKKENMNDYYELSLIVIKDTFKEIHGLIKKQILKEHKFKNQNNKFLLKECAIMLNDYCLHPMRYSLIELIKMIEHANKLCSKIYMEEWNEQ